MMFLIVLLVLIGIFVISNYVARSIRTPESGTGIGVIVSSIVAASWIIFTALQPEVPLNYKVQEGDTIQSIAEKFDNVNVKSLADANGLTSPDDLTVGKDLQIPNPKRLEIKRGVDLSGGVILIYEVDNEQSVARTQGDEDSAELDETVDVQALVEALTRRINPGGVKEVVIRPYGDKQVEIVIPDVDDAEVDRIKRQIVRAGFLRFLILAKRSDHPTLFAQAQAQPNVRIVRQGGQALGEWIRIARTEDGNEFKVQVEPSENLVRETRPGQVEVLMAYDQFRVEGKHLRSVSKGYDDHMAPAVNFAMTSSGSRLFGGLTTTNLPDEQTGRHARLGIVMDNELISAPIIQSKISGQGQISGRFSDEEVEELVNVLRAGRLPAVLKPEPISENRIDPLLGADTIRKGSFAIGASLIAVLVFMLIYYRFAGVVACIALLMNLLLTLGLMILISGAFSLPGLAGMVLTVGMSVDANVLIFERIREELNRGAALRMAIRNGFSRATTTIVDANITTLITAIVLYVIGTDQLRGFAVTLILGILMSMFTAIYCSRIVFDVADRLRWLKKLTMMQLLNDPKINFMRSGKLAMTLSSLVILVGLVAVVARGRGLFDIDFLGGTSVQAELKQGMTYEEVRSRIDGLADDLSITRVNREGSADNTVWKIDTSVQDNRELEQRLAEKFSANGQSLFKTHSVSIEPNPPRVLRNSDSSSSTISSPPTTGPSDADATGETDFDSGVIGGPSADDPAENAETDASGDTEASDPVEASDAGVLPGSNDGASTPLPPDHVLAFADDIRLAQLSTRDALANANTAVDGQRCATKLSFDERVTRDTLMESLRVSAEALGVAEPTMYVTGPQGQTDSAAGFTEWDIEADTDPASLGSILAELKRRLESEPAWLSSSKIGGKVAGDAKSAAVFAILTSLVFIVGYLWLRFHGVIYGLSAVVALVHDVLITLGAIAISMYVSKSLGFLLIDEFKISLPIVAAFLTIIGYSLNDTIVVFDRVREVKGRSPDITEEMINTSINQTLSRTMLTSLTTLLVVAILYAFGGQGIHGFAFALLVGVLVGTYSSVFVACPALLWMSRFQEKESAAASGRKKPAGASAK